MSLHQITNLIISELRLDVVLHPIVLEGVALYVCHRHEVTINRLEGDEGYT